MGRRVVRMVKTRFPKFGYHLDESDTDIVILRRQDGAFVAAFSAQGATREGILEAAKADYGKVIEANAESSLAFERTATERGAPRRERLEAKLGA